MAADRGGVGCDEVAERLPPELAFLALAYALPDRHEAFRLACFGGDLPLARTLASALSLSAREAYANETLFATCTGGHLAIAQWMRERFGRAPWIPWLGVRALRDACSQGHLALARWVALQSGVTAGDIRRWDEWRLFGAVCEQGHLEVAVWLDERFGPIASRPEAHDAALHAACASGRLEVVQWLAARLPPGPNVALFLLAAGANGRLGVVRWLVERFGPGPADAKDALRQACRADRLPVVAWLVARFGHELAAAAYRARDEGECGDEVAEWLEERLSWSSGEGSDTEADGGDGAEEDDAPLGGGLADGGGAGRPGRALDAPGVGGPDRAAPQNGRAGGGYHSLGQVRPDAE